MIRGLCDRRCVNQGDSGCEAAQLVVYRGNQFSKGSEDVSNPVDPAILTTSSLSMGGSFCSTLISTAAACIRHSWFHGCRCLNVRTSSCSRSRHQVDHMSDGSFRRRQNRCRRQSAGDDGQAQNSVPSIPSRSNRDRSGGDDQNRFAVIQSRDVLQCHGRTTDEERDGGVSTLRCKATTHGTDEKEQIAERNKIRERAHQRRRVV